MFFRTLLGMFALVTGAMILSAFALDSAWAGRVPPKVSYHYGEQKYLQRNAQIDEVPEDDWRKFVMGEGTSYDLPMVRRGLYTGTDLTSISHYTPNCGTGKTPWIKAIHLKDACREPKAVGDISDLKNDAKFKEWFDKKLDKEELAKKLLSSPVFKQAGPCLESFDQFAQSAFEYSGRPKIRYHKYHRIKGENENTEIHEYVINEWIKFNDFKVMLNDNAHEKPSEQWYIRDKSCIEKIDGTPEEVLQMVAARKDFFFSFRQVRDGRREKIVDDYDSTAVIFLRALAEAKTLDPKVLQAVRANVLSSGTRMPQGWKPAFERIIDGAAKCGGKLKVALDPFLKTYESQCTYQDFGQAAAKVEEACP